MVHPERKPDLRIESNGSVVEMFTPTQLPDEEIAERRKQVLEAAWSIVDELVARDESV